MAVNKWKVTAIIFLILFLVETLFIYWAYSEGNKEINYKIKCSNEICFNQKLEAFTVEGNVCNCWQGNEIIYREIMK